MKDTNMINMQFKQKNMNFLWNKLKGNKKLKVNSNINAEEFGCHFQNLTKDNEPFNVGQLRIQTIVNERYSNLSKNSFMPF